MTDWVSSEAVSSWLRAQPATGGTAAAATAAWLSVTSTDAPADVIHQGSWSCGIARKSAHTSGAIATVDTLAPSLPASWPNSDRAADADATVAAGARSVADSSTLASTLASDFSL